MSSRAWKNGCNESMNAADTERPDKHMPARIALKHKSLRPLLITLGWVSIVLGVAGIFLPLLPTTPFILLAAWCFARSSEKFHRWLLDHPKLGPIVHTWEQGEGLPRKIRNRTLIAMWLGMLVSILIVGRLWATLGLITIGSCVSIYLLRLPVRDDEPAPMQQSNQQDSQAP